MLKAEIYGTVNIWQPEYFGFFAAYIYVNSAQNHNFKLVTMNGYIHNLFTYAAFNAIV